MARRTSSNEQKNEAVELDIKVLRANQFKDSDNIGITLEINGIKIYNAVYIDMSAKKKDDFISWPSYKGSDGNYYNYVYVSLTSEQVKDISNQIDKLL